MTPLALLTALTLAILRVNPHLSHADAHTHASHVVHFTSGNQIDPWLVTALVAVESGWHEDAVRVEKGQYAGTCSVGLGQINILCGNVHELRRLTHGRTNLECVVKFLVRLRKKFHGPDYPDDWFAGYNPGDPGYVARVLAMKAKLQAS